MKYKRGYFVSNMYKRAANGSLVHAKVMQGRNEKCHCKSGKKFKHCHGAVRILTLSRGPLGGYGFFIWMLGLFFIGLALIFIFMVG